MIGRLSRFLLLAALLLPGVATAGDVYVEGYYRSDGTYVRPPRPLLARQLQVEQLRAFAE